MKKRNNLARRAREDIILVKGKIKTTQINLAFSI
tara:strand:- start:1317 stop:1418 length:102 start_codon:yes stop_codon:yes gene_type:complete